MASTMWMIGDSLAQYLERVSNKDDELTKQKSSQNFSRTLKMGLIGLCWNGPFSSWWLRFLDRRFGNSPQSVYKKLFFDQTCQNPVLTGGIIFLVGLSNNLPVDKSAKIVQENLLPVMYKGWVYWT